MKKKDTLKKIEMIYKNLEKAYDISGELRDSFNYIGGSELKLKNHCNNIRGRIYELREIKSNFQYLIQSFDNEKL